MSCFCDPNAFRNHGGCAMRGENCAFLPGQKVTAKVSGKIDAIIRFHEGLVWTFVIFATCPRNPRALTERDLFPVDVHGAPQILAMTLMQAFNGRA